MSVVIPASDLQSTALNGTITALTAVIAANPNSATITKLTQDRQNARFNLVMHLLGAGHLSATSILANESYITQPVGDGQ